MNLVHLPIQLLNDLQFYFSTDKEWLYFKFVNKDLYNNLTFIKYKSIFRYLPYEADPRKVTIFTGTAINNYSVLSNLVSLNCSNCDLEFIPYLPETLQNLDCSSNLLNSLPDCKNLVTLDCSSNELTYLRGLPNLVTLDASFNLIDRQPNCPKLKKVYMCCNDLCSFTLFPGMEYVDISINAITILNVHSTIEELKHFLCYDNLIKRLPRFGNNIEVLSFDNNRVSELFIQNPERLRVLSAVDNLLEKLPEGMNNLLVLRCYGNRKLEHLPETGVLYRLAYSGITNNSKVEYHLGYVKD